jgi:hypothetical protein
MDALKKRGRLHLMVLIIKIEIYIGIGQSFLIFTYISLPRV